jgi:hypothetical protein
VNPYVFIVGCPRSGTTLLERLVDSHRQVAITPETHWIPRWFQKKRDKGITVDGLATDKLLRKLLNFPRFHDLGISDEAVKKLLKGDGPVSYARFISGIFDLYGRRHGKSIVGDKTPGYAREIPTLSALWPFALFIHLIRDGRDVALSILNWDRAKSWPAGEGAARFRHWDEDRLATAALWWEWHVRLAREAGNTLGPDRYYELRYEALVGQPAAECRKLCTFLNVPYDDAMLQSYEDRARSGVPHDGKHPWRPITIGLRNWQTQMAPADVRRFEALAGPMLAELGYPCVAETALSATGAATARVRVEFADDARFQRFSVPQGW